MELIFPSVGYSIDKHIMIDTMSQQHNRLKKWYNQQTEDKRDKVKWSMGEG